MELRPAPLAGRRRQPSADDVNVVVLISRDPTADASDRRDDATGVLAPDEHYRDVFELGSLSKPARIPFVGVVSRRGDLGEFNLAQVPFGYAVGGVLDAMGIRNAPLGPGEVRRRVDMAAKTAFSTEEPYVLLAEPTLTGAKDEF